MAQCDYCQVRYRRSQLVKQRNGLLACSGPGTLDDARGRDEVTLDQQNAAATRRNRRRTRAADGRFDRHQRTPKDILGSASHTWLKAESPGDFRFGPGGVAAWINHGRTGDPTQPDESLRPTYDATGFNGSPCVVGDGTQWMACTLSPPIAAGARPYMWLVARFDQAPLADPVISAPASLWHSTTAEGDGDSFRRLAPYASSVVANLQSQIRPTASDGNVDTSVGPAFDTSGHLFELGALETTTGEYVVDGVAFDGANTLTFDLEMGALALFVAIPGQSAFSIASIAEVVVASLLPTDAQKLAMRSYFRSRPLGLSIA